MFDSKTFKLQAILVAQDRLTPILRNAQASTQRFAGVSAKSLATTALKFLGVTSAAYATYKAIKFAITSYSDFTNAMAEVSTLVDTSKVNMDAMTQSILHFSNATGVDATQAAKALYQTISAGVDASKAMDVLAVAQKTALGGVAGLTESVDLLTNILNAYHMSANKAIDVSDKMFIAVKEGKTTIPELAQSLGMVAPFAAQAGIGIGEVASTVAELTKGGLDTAEAVTGIRQLINSIISASNPIKQYAARTLHLAFSAKALKKAGLIEFLQKLKERTGGNIDKLSKLFPDVRALNAVLALTGSGFKDLIRINDEMQYSFGATDEAAAKMRSTFKYQAQLAGTHVKNAFIKLGNAISFVLKPALQAFNGLFSKNKDDESQRLKALRGLLDEYDKLKKKVKLTADELERLQDIRDRIAQLSPELAKKYDKEGHAIELVADATKKLNFQQALASLNQIPKLVQGLNQVANYHIGNDIIRTSAFDAMDRLTKKIQDLKKEIPSEDLLKVVTQVTPKYQEKLSMIAPGVDESMFTQIRNEALAYMKNPSIRKRDDEWMKSGSASGKIMKVYVDYLQQLTNMEKKNLITHDDLIRVWDAFANEGLKSVASIKAPRKELQKLQQQLDSIGSVFIQQASAVLMAEQAMKAYAESLPKGEERNAWLEKMKMLATPAYNWGQKFMETYAKGVIAGGGVLKPEIEKILKQLGDLLELHSPAKAGPLSKLDQWGKKFIPTYLDGIKSNAGKLIGGITGFLRPLENTLSKVGLGNMASGIGSIIGKFNRIKGMIGDIVGSAKGIMQIFTGNPVGGLMTVITKIVSLMKSTPEGRKALQKIFEIFKKIEKPVGKILDAVIKALTPLVDLLADILAPIADFLASAIIDPLNWLANIIDGIINGFQGFLKGVMDVGKAIINFIVAPFKWVWNILKNMFGWLFGGSKKKTSPTDNIEKAKKATRAEQKKEETKNETKNLHVGTIEIHSNASDPRAVADEVMRRLGLEGVAHG